MYAGLYSNRGASHQVLKAILAERIEPVLSVALLFEYEDVLKRSSRQLGIKYADIDKFLDAICSVCSLQKIYYLWRPFLQDPKDDLVLELAVASGAKTITTFNRRDFKGVDEFGVRILSPKELLEDTKWEL